MIISRLLGGNLVNQQINQNLENAFRSYFLNPLNLQITLDNDKS